MAAPEIESFRGRLLRELDRVVKALDGLDGAAVNWKPPAANANTLNVLARHTFGAALDHVVRQVAGKQITRSRDAEFAATGATDDIPRLAEATKREIFDALEDFDPRRLGEESRSLAARRVERRGLQLDAVEIRGLAGKGPRCGDLAELAIAEREDGLRDDRDDLGLR